MGIDRSLSSLIPDLLKLAKQPDKLSLPAEYLGTPLAAVKSKPNPRKLKMLTNGLKPYSMNFIKLRSGAKSIKK